MIIDSPVISGSFAASFRNVAITGSLGVTGSITTTGTITAQTLVVQTITSSTDFVTGSTRFGSLATNTHQFTGSMYVTCSITTNKVILSGGADQSELTNATNNDFKLTNSGNFRIVNNSNTVALLTVQNGGNIGIGVTPSAWSGSTENALQVKKASIYEYGGYETALSINTYYDGVWKYIGTNSATQLQLSAGNYIFRNAGSGTAGTTITWTDRMYISSSGNVGIGTSIPSSRLDLGVGTGGTLLTIQDGHAKHITSGYVVGSQYFYGSNQYGQIASSNTGFNFTTYNSVNFIFNTGNVGIGTTSATSPLTVKAASRGDMLRLSISGASSVGDATGITFGSATYDKAQIIAYNENTGNAAGYLTFWTGGSPATTDMTERIRITSAGLVGIGTTAPPFQLTVARDLTNEGDIAAGQFAVCGASILGKRLVVGYDTNGNGYGFIESGYLGNAWTYTAIQGSGGNVVIGQLTDPGYKLSVNGQPGANGYTAWTNYSDSRLKSNITDLEATNVLNKICAIRPVTFNYNELSGYDEATRSRRISGFIAQELMEVFPDMVGTINKKDFEYYDTNLSNLNLYLVKAIQELKAEFDTYKTTHP
jgi:hypothetical protein